MCVSVPWEDWDGTEHTASCVAFLLCPYCRINYEYKLTLQMCLLSIMYICHRMYHFWSSEFVVLHRIFISLWGNNCNGEEKCKSQETFQFNWKGEIWQKWIPAWNRLLMSRWETIGEWLLWHGRKRRTSLKMMQYQQDLDLERKVWNKDWPWDWVPYSNDDRVLW